MLSRSLNIAIIDPSITWRFIVSSLLEKNNINVLLKCKDEYDFLENTVNHRIDALIIDIDFQDRNGIEIIQLLKHKNPQIQIFIFTKISTILIKEKLNILGVIQCFNKKDYDLLEKSIFDYFNLPKPKNKLQAYLSDEELKLVRLICLDFDKYEISEKLNISLSSYEKKRKSIADKLKLKNTPVALVIWAFKNHLIDF